MNLLSLQKRLQTLRIVQGPLAGVSLSVFRDLVWQYSNPAWVYSEMVSCKTILYGSDVIRNRFLHVSQTEGPLCLQIATSCPEECARACEQLNQYPIQMIDLNVGCPVKKIRKRNQGSSLLSQPDLLHDLIRAMRNHTDKAVSVKIRVDGNSEHTFNAGVLAAINQAGPDFLVVHGRHYQDGYQTPCHLEQIEFFARHANMPVIGNGDVSDAITAQAMLNIGCSGVMVSRAAVGAPWLLAEIQSGLNLINNPITLCIEQRWHVFLRHIELLSQFFGGDKIALMHAKGLIKYYAKRNGFSNVMCQVVYQAETCADMVLAQLD